MSIAFRNRLVRWEHVGHARRSGRRIAFFLISPDIYHENAEVFKFDSKRSAKRAWRSILKGLGSGAPLLKLDTGGNPIK